MSGNSIVFGEEIRILVLQIRTFSRALLDCIKQCKLNEQLVENCKMLTILTLFTFLQSKCQTKWPK